MRKILIATVSLALLYIACPVVKADPCEPNIIASIDINPNTINLKSKGNWITCYIWLPEDHNVSDIDAESIFLEGVIEAEWKWFEIEDQVLMVKFDRQALHDLLEPADEVDLTVSGYLVDGNDFEGTDTVRVIGPVVPPFAIKRLRIRNRNMVGRGCVNISGTIDVNSTDVAGASSINVCIWPNSDPNNPILDESINFSTNDVKKEKFKYRNKVRKNDDGAITSFNLDMHRHKFSLKAKNLDLSNLDYPLTLEIEVGAYNKTDEWP